MAEQRIARFLRKQAAKYVAAIDVMLQCCSHGERVREMAGGGTAARKTERFAASGAMALAKLAVPSYRHKEPRKLSSPAAVRFAARKSSRPSTLRTFALRNPEA